MNSENKRTPIYGRNAVTELLNSPNTVDTVLLANNLDNGTLRHFSALARRAGAVVKNVPQEHLNTLCDGRHQGVAAFASEVVYCDVDDLFARARARNEAPFFLLCDGVEDPHNLGALLRSAALCGAHGAILPKRGAAGVSPVVMKASAGAAAVLPIARVTNLADTIRNIKKQGVFVFCADMDGVPIGKQNLSGPIALVMGSEGKGVRQLTRKLCDGVLSLPMADAGGVDSFNVSVAGGILLYEIFRTRHL